MADRHQIARWVRIVGFLLVLCFAVWQTGVASEERAQKNDLIDVLSRRSPITDYQAAEFGHNDCRKNYEDAYLAAIGRAIISTPNDPTRADAIAAVATYTAVLAAIEVHCPTPLPPEFDDEGRMTKPPHLPPTTTSTTLAPGPGR